MFKRRGIPLERTVVAHTRDGRLIVGILIGSFKDAFVLKGASTPEGERFMGDVVIPRENIALFQADVPVHLLKTVDEE